MRYATIEDFVENEHPNHYILGHWGCCKITEDPLKDLQKSHPEGKLVDVVCGIYWFWTW